VLPTAAAHPSVHAVYVVQAALAAVPHVLAAVLAAVPYVPAAVGQPCMQLLPPTVGHTQAGQVGRHQ
jgi:hypothetical protein